MHYLITTGNIVAHCIPDYKFVGLCDEQAKTLNNYSYLK